LGLTETGRLGTPGDESLLTNVELILQEQFEELAVIEVVAACFLKAQLQRGGQTAQTQLIEGLSQLGVHVKMSPPTTDP